MVGPSTVEQEPKFVLMFSGGLDSYLAFLTLLDNGIDPVLVYVEHGSKNNDEQLFQAKKLAKKHKKELIIDRTLSLKHLEQDNAFIPNRNGLLAFIGANYGDFIYFAIMDGEQTYTDCRRETFMSLSMALTNLSGRPVIADSPFWDKTKAEVINDLDPKYWPDLMDTYSCHRGGDKHCGHCTACFRRWVAFEVNGLSDVWEVHPARTGLAEDYYSRVMDGMTDYGDKRNMEIMKAFDLAGVDSFDD